MARRIAYFLFISILHLSSVSAINNKKQGECVYTVYTRTGSVVKSGTDARIGVTFGDADGTEVHVPDLKSWGGAMGPDHDYFERGNLDVFTGLGPCGLHGPICRMNVSSDGSGSHHGWFCEYVEVTGTGPHVPCMQTTFYVEQWLARDAPPYQLYAAIDGCDKVARDRTVRRRMRMFEVRRERSNRKIKKLQPATAGFTSSL